MSIFGEPSAEQKKTASEMLNKFADKIDEVATQVVGFVELLDQNIDNVDDMVKRYSGSLREKAAELHEGVKANAEPTRDEMIAYIADSIDKAAPGIHNAWRDPAEVANAGDDLVKFVYDNFKNGI